MTMKTYAKWCNKSSSTLKKQFHENGRLMPTQPQDKSWSPRTDISAWTVKQGQNKITHQVTSSTIVSCSSNSKSRLGDKWIRSNCLKIQNKTYTCVWLGVGWGGETGKGCRDFLKVENRVGMGVRGGWACSPFHLLFSMSVMMGRNLQSSCLITKEHKYFKTFGLLVYFQLCVLLAHFHHQIFFLIS